MGWLLAHYSGMSNVTTRASVSRKAPKFIKSGMAPTVSNIQEFLANEYGAAMRAASAGGLKAGEAGETWATLEEWFTAALAARGVVVVDE